MMVSLMVNLIALINDVNKCVLTTYPLHIKSMVVCKSYVYSKSKLMCIDNNEIT